MNEKEQKMEERVRKLIKKGRDCYDQEQYENALSIFNEVLNVYPENMYALNKIGDIYYEQSNLTEALDTFNNLRSICKRFGFLEKEKRVLEDIGRVYTLLGKYSVAVNIYLEALAIYDEIESTKGKMEEGKLTLLYKVSELYYRQKNYERALLTYGKLLHLHSQFGIVEGIADDLTEIGKILYKQKKFSKATSKLKEALQIYEGQELLSKMVIIQFELGRICYKSNQYSEALPYLKETLSSCKKLGLEKPDDYYYEKTKKMLKEIKNL